MVKVPSGVAKNQPLPPIDVDQPPVGALPYRVRDGLHRYYASVAVRWAQRTHLVHFCTDNGLSMSQAHYQVTLRYRRMRSSKGSYIR
jgi:hypothetical protein